MSNLSKEALTQATAQTGEETLDAGDSVGGADAIIQSFLEPADIEPTQRVEGKIELLVPGSEEYIEQEYQKAKNQAEKIFRSPEYKTLETARRYIENEVPNIIIKFKKEIAEELRAAIELRILSENQFAQALARIDDGIILPHIYLVLVYALRMIQNFTTYYPYSDENLNNIRAIVNSIPQLTSNQEIIDNFNNLLEKYQQKSQK